ncbi:MAG: hypothetical protein ACYTHM_05500 [Planctomycetota bacterium]|jgi:hypothetical protein
MKPFSAGWAGRYNFGALEGNFLDNLKSEDMMNMGLSRDQTAPVATPPPHLYPGACSGFRVTGNEVAGLAKLPVSMGSKGSGFFNSLIIEELKLDSPARRKAVHGMEFVELRE